MGLSLFFFFFLGGFLFPATTMPSGSERQIISIRRDNIRKRNDDERNNENRQLSEMGDARKRNKKQ